MKRLLTRTWLTIKHFAQRTYRNVRALGWFWGMFAVFISGVIFYSPAIVCVVIFGVTGNAWYLGLATTYVVWWFSPLFSPALLVYFALLGGVIAIINKIGMALRRRENKRWNHEKTYHILLAMACDVGVHPARLCERTRSGHNYLRG